MGALVAIAVGLLGGAWAAVLGLRLGPAWMGSAAVLGLGILVAFSARSAAVRPGRRAWLPFALAAGLVGQSLAAPPRRVQVPQGVLRVEGVVLASRHARSASAVVEVERGVAIEHAAPVPWRARIGVSGLDVPQGTRVRLLARGRASDAFFNPTPHPDWPGARRTDASARLVGGARVLAPAPFWQRAAHRLRALVRSRLDETLSPAAAALSRALLLGESGAIDADAREGVRDAGLSHVLAVSGLHVTLLAGTLVWLLGRALVRIEPLAARFEVSRLAKGLGVPIVLSYALLVGDAPSAWRAAITASLAWSLAALGRRANPVAVTAGAAIVLGVLRPDDVARPGFLLSIVATAALVSGPSVRDGFARAALAVSARTTVATAPFVLFLFGQVPIVGLLANIVVVPLAAGLLLPAVAIHAVVALLAPPLAHVSGPIVELASSAFLAASEVFAAIPVGHDLPPPDVAQSILVAFVALGLLAARRWRTRALVIVLGVLAIGAAELALRAREEPSGELRVTFLDVGQGDGAIVDLPDGRLMVIDAGGATLGGPDPGAHVLVPLLHARRRARIDVLVLSHPHPDHYGGAGALLEAFEVGEIWDTGQGEDEQPEGTLAALLARARALGAVVLQPDALCGRERSFGGASARVLWPCPAFDAGFGPNDNSLVVELRHAGRRLWFTGDVEVHGEAALLERAPSPVDVLKVAHHGSRTSSEARLIRALRPAIAVASMGRQNRFGHPHAEVWTRLVAGAGCAYRTDRDGGVVVRVAHNGRLSAEGTLGAACEAPPASTKW